MTKRRRAPPAVSRSRLRRDTWPNLTAYWRTFGSREHAIMAIQHASRFLLGSLPAEQIGMWYIFFKPEDVESVAAGTVAFGGLRRPGLRVVYLRAPASDGKKPKKPVREPVHLAFETEAARDRVWADLLADEPGCVLPPNPARSDGYPPPPPTARKQPMVAPIIVPATGPKAVSPHADKYDDHDQPDRIGRAPAENSSPARLRLPGRTGRIATTAAASHAARTHATGDNPNRAAPKAQPVHAPSKSTAVGTTPSARANGPFDIGSSWRR